MMVAAKMTQIERYCRELVPGYDAWATAPDGAWFDPVAAQKAVDFFAECLEFIEGDKAGQPFVLEPWQQAIVGNIYGWRDSNGNRLYREVFVFVPRKNGKTPWLAGLMCYEAFCGGEPGAQLYSAAADREQAALIYRHASGMIAREPELEKRCTLYRTYKSIEISETNTVFKALSADADTKHGLNVQLAAIDELHAHPNRDLVDVLLTGTASRTQPIIIYITTSDFNRPSICNEKHDYASKVRDGIIEDSSFLPVIFEASADDDWTAPETWKKANPNLGVSVSESYMERECKRAQEEPTYENTFKRLHLNIKTEQDVRWLQMAAWDACDGPVDDSIVAELPCWGGLDLASTTDIAAFVKVFKDEENDRYLLVPRFWIPEMDAIKREKRDRVPYLTWARQGFVTLTGGNVIDYSAIRRDINQDCDIYYMRDIGYDPWNATQIATELSGEDGIPMVKFRQGFVSMNEPTKEFGRLLTKGAIAHGGNPVLRWMASNATVKMDPSGNLKPDKSKSTEKIDGIVAAIMGLGRAMVGEESFEPGVYFV